MEWIEAGMTFRQARRWVSIGVHSLKAAEAWKRGPRPYDAAKAWLAAGVADPLDAAAWSAAFGDIDGAQPWLAHDLGPDEASAWNSAGFTAGDYATWCAVGRDAARVDRWRQVTSDDPGRARAWIAMGVTDPASAERLMGHGVTPNEYDRWRRLDPTGDVLSARAHLSVDAAEEWAVRLEAPLQAVIQWHGVAGGELHSAALWAIDVDVEPTEAARWQASGFGPAEAREWKDAGVGDPAAAAAWRAAHLSPAECRAWTRLGAATAEQASDLIRLSGQGDAGQALSSLQGLAARGVPAPQFRDWLPHFRTAEVVDWLDVGVRQGDHARRWRGAGFTPVQAKAWAAVVSDPQLAGEWVEVVGDDPATAAAWSAAGASDPADALAYLRLGLDPGATSQWKALGVLGVGSVALWCALWDLPSAMAWTSGLGVDVGAAHSWEEYTSSDLGEARSWVESGVATVAEAEQWLATGFDATTARIWAGVGFSSDAATAWSTAGYTAVDAGAWRDVLSTALELVTPVEADAWRDTQMGPAEVARWLRCSVTSPDRVAQLHAIGLEHQAYAELYAEHDAVGLQQALRRQAVLHAGLALEEDIPTLSLEGRPAAVASIPMIARAAANAGWPQLRIRHGWPHLTPPAVRALPGARYVRGGEKAAFVLLLDSVVATGVEGASRPPFASWSHCTDGRATDLELDGRTPTAEFMALGVDTDA